MGAAGPKVRGGSGKPKKSKKSRRPSELVVGDDPLDGSSTMPSPAASSLRGDTPTGRCFGEASPLPSPSVACMPAPAAAGDAGAALGAGLAVNTIGAARGDEGAGSHDAEACPSGLLGA